MTVTELLALAHKAMTRVTYTGELHPRIAEQLAHGYQLARAVIELLETPEPKHDRANARADSAVMGWEPSVTVHTHRHLGTTEARGLAVALLRAADEADNA